jgi:hypothetical protein
MMKMVFAIEIMAMFGLMVAIKKNRTLAEHIIPAVIMIVAHYMAWQM